MASPAATPSRGPRRILQACETCRRKKTRCPGERPRCSNCTRLRQHCRYPSASVYDDGGHAAQSSIQSLQARLAELEDKLDQVLDRPGMSPRQAETPHTVGTNAPAAATASSPPISQPPHASHSSLLPSRDAIAKAIEIYFLCGHRQPVWLFDPPSKLNPDCSEELLLTVLGLSVQYAPNDFAEAQLQTPSAYNDAARVLIMLKVANSTIDLATLQSLCLLTYSNLVCGDVQLASFHVTLANNLLQCSGLDTHASNLRASFLEEQRRLYWSIQTLSVVCGLPVRTPSTLDIKSPRFLVPEETPRRIAGHAPLLPLDLPNSRGERALGIWAHSVRSATLWGMVRVYIWRCAEGQAKAPWQPNSDYVAINAQLLDMECAFPTSSRFDSARFMERPLEELLRNRDFWLPWMKIQMIFHTLHAVLNHPFLYSSRVSKPKPGPNGFWKTSTDLALVHSTWISRLLGMAVRKGFPLADPFFAYAAAVAVTLHIYWSRAADPKIRAPAEKNLDLCRSFIVELGTHWPLCQTIAEDVDQLIRLCSQDNEPPEDSATALSGHISLMWKILDFASMQRSRSLTEQRLFQASWDADLRSRSNSHEQMALEDPEMASPPGDFQTSVGNYAAPPDWFSPPEAGSSAHADKPSDGSDRPTDSDNITMGATGQTETQQRVPWTGWAWNTGDANMAYDPLAQLYNRSVPDSGWWDYGNL